MKAQKLHLLFTLFLKTILVFILMMLFGSSFAQQGKDGAGNIAGTSIVNEYAVLTSDAAIGNTTISVDNSGLNNNGRFAAALAEGDLIMIIQMQGASINGNIADSTWGMVTSYNNCGNYEFQQVKSVPDANTIELECALQKDYTASGRTQVVRVPRYSSLTVGGTINGEAWNGSIGGVISVEVQGQTTIDGSIDASEIGFRGGQIDDLSGFQISAIASPNSLDGGEKGEGIAGFQADYDAMGGRYCKGPAANGGGGGNGHNAAGGGGANVGNVANWNGMGNPDISNPAWVQAWDLEGAGFSNNISTGGGRGGYSWSDFDGNALVDGPNNIPAWGGTDGRTNQGGLGGIPLQDFNTQRLFLGGGGGAGDQNNFFGGLGGNGGGLVYLMAYGNVGGNGTILANGQVGDGACCSGNGGYDGSGGSGAGGTIVVNAVGTIAGISVIANGAAGGSQDIDFGMEAEGPGGGGGGGYINTSNGGIFAQADGGANGTTNSPGMTEFPPNGATSGGGGTMLTTITNYYLSTTDDTVCTGEQGTVTASVNGMTPTGMSAITWYDAAIGGNLVGTGSSFTSPPLTTTTTYYATVCPGTYREPATIVVEEKPQADFVGPDVCLNNASDFTDQSTFSGPYTRHWTFGEPSSGASDSSDVQDPSHTYSDVGAYDVTLIVSTTGGCSDTIVKTVEVFPLPIADYSSTIPDPCFGDPTDFSDLSSIPSGSIVSWAWNFGEPSSGGNNLSTLQHPSHTYAGPGTYSTILTVTSDKGCQSSITKTINVSENPIAAFSADTVCLGNLTSFFDSSSVNGTSIVAWLWDFGDGNTSTDQNPQHVYANSGNFTVNLTVTTTGGCTAQTMVRANVLPGPIADFTLSPDQVSILDPTIYFTDQSINAENGAWIFGDGDSVDYQTEPNPVHVYPDDATGTYSATLIVEKFGCIDSITKMVDVAPYWTLYTPDAFTPNEDGTNETFYSKGEGILEYEMWIFDRWGNEIFHCEVDDLPQHTLCHWDGKANGGSLVAQQDVYVWMIEFTNIFNEKHKRIGHVSMVR